MLYDKREKKLIQSKEREFIEWQFALSSPYTIVKNSS